MRLMFGWCLLLIDCLQVKKQVERVLLPASALLVIVCKYLSGSPPKKYTITMTFHVIANMPVSSLFGLQMPDDSLVVGDRICLPLRSMYLPLRLQLRCRLPIQRVRGSRRVQSSCFCTVQSNGVRGLFSCGSGVIGISFQECGQCNQYQPLCVSSLYFSHRH